MIIINNGKELEMMFNGKTYILKNGDNDICDDAAIHFVEAARAQGLDISKGVKKVKKEVKKEKKEVVKEVKKKLFNKGKK